jgi:hypothetical protein
VSFEQHPVELNSSPFCRPRPAILKHFGEP